MVADIWTVDAWTVVIHYRQIAPTQVQHKTMATTTATTTSSSETLQLGSKIETFAVPGSRTVHGKTFPLGIRPKDDQQFQTVESAVEYLKGLAETGVFDRLLSQRK
jgi:hypothetical protein